MANNNALKYYKSGINKVNAAPNPFAGESDELGDDPKITQSSRSAPVKRNNFIYVAAAVFAVLFGLSAYMITKGMNIEHTVNDSSKVIMLNSDSESKTKKTDPQYDTLDKAVAAYRSAENKIQEYLFGFQTSRDYPDFNNSQLQKYQKVLNEQSEIQQLAVRNIMKLKEEGQVRDDIIILDARQVDDLYNTVKLVLLNTTDNSITLNSRSGIISYESDVSCTLTNNCTISQKGGRCSAYIDISQLKDFDIAKEYTFEFYDNSGKQVSRAATGFESINAMSPDSENTLYGDFNMLDVISTAATR